MKRTLAAWLSATLVCASVHAEQLPTAGQGDPRIRVVAYSADEVYRLYAAVGYDLRLEFAPEEQFVSIDGGDLDAITYSAQANVFSFKPRTWLADTNFAITTNRHHYYFRYSTLSEPVSDAADRPVMYVVRFQYPPETDPETLARSHQEQIERDLANSSAHRLVNQDYWYCGAPSLKPVAAFDDGVHTRFRFPPRAELPAIFVRNADGSESLLNFTIEEGDAVLHRLAPQFVLRRGSLRGCIVNKGFAGGGTRLQSGTVSEDVQRATKAPQP